MLLSRYLLCESGWFPYSEWERESSWGGRGGEPESNNLAYTKRLKDMYANRKHETTPYDFYLELNIKSEQAKIRAFKKLLFRELKRLFLACQN